MSDFGAPASPATPSIAKRTRIAAAVVAVVAVVGALMGSAYAFQLGPFGSDGLGPVIARVDGRPIYLSEARERLASLTTMHGEAGTLGAEWEQRILQSLIDDQILMEEAGRLGIVVSDEEIATHLQRIEGMFSSLEEFQKWLDSQQMTVDELERRIELQTFAARVYTAVTADVTVSEQQMRRYYESHQQEFVGADGSTSSFKQVRDSIEQTLAKQQQDQTYADWLAQQRQAVSVEVVDSDWWRSIT
jgi:hypothetical protein